MAETNVHPGILAFRMQLLGFFQMQTCTNNSKLLLISSDRAVHQTSLPRLTYHRGSDIADTHSAEV